MQQRQQLTCVVVIGANNAPLYLTQIDSSGQPSKACRQLQEVIYNSLDVIEERASTTRNRPRDGYLGCLAVVGGTAVYASTSATRFTVIITGTGSNIEESSIRYVLSNIKSAVVDVVSDPFWDGSVFQSRKFEKRISMVAAEFAANNLPKSA